MSKNNVPMPGEPVKSEPVVPPVMKMSLDEFCLLESSKMKKPELIGGFHFVQKRDGRLKATEAEYRERFEAFKRTPV